MKLRDCPFCHSPANNELTGVILTSETILDPVDGSDIHVNGYTVSCCNCGTSVSDEYLEECVVIWNGEPTHL